MKSLYFKTLKMMVCLLICISSSPAIAQIQFEQVLPQPPAPQIIADFEGVNNSFIAFADVDGDNDQDVLITGRNNSNQRVAKLYTNDGNGNFSLVSGTPFDGVENASIAFADVDGDNDQDVLITSVLNAKLYINDGNGNFSLVSGTPFDEVDDGSIAFADVDGDNDQDVLITGRKSSNQRIAKLYTNDGSGNFSLITGTPFDGVILSSIAFADVDGDNDQDVLITGRNSSSQETAKLYTNDGNGNFSLVTGTPFEGVLFSSIAFADGDGDNDQDVLITGRNDSNQKIAKLYTNDGIGNFSLISGTPFDEVENASIAFADVDGDNDQDVLITGMNSSGSIAKLYTNDSNGNFSLISGTPFEKVESSSIAFADVDGDNDQDVIITGWNGSDRIAKLYTNDGNANFSFVSGTPFDEVDNGSIAFADVDGDGDQDVLITGFNSSNQRIAKFYTNDGSGNLSLVSGTPFDGVRLSSIAFADVDGDNDQDVLITGRNSSFQEIAQLYNNDGSGNFSLVSSTPFDGVETSSIAFADVDGDNDQDVLITGRNSSNQQIAKLYTNDGSGNFSLVSGTPFDGVWRSSVAFADVDGDNDQDVLITGDNGSNGITKLYINDGNGNFSLVSGTPFDWVQRSSVAFADVDGDNDQDVLITGRNSSNQKIAKLYANDGSGNFSLVTSTPFDGVWLSSIAFADVDGDNDQDVLITGRNSSNQKIAKLYANDGSGNFSLVISTPFDGVWLSSIAFADIDSDNDPDVLITGSNSSDDLISKLYRNITDNTNPVAITQDITVQLGNNGQAIISANDVDNGSSDNIGIASSVLDVSSFDCSNLGDNTVTLTVTDDYGNSNSATAVVTVEDVLDPVAITQDITVQLNNNGQVSISANDINNSSFDNCNIASSVLDVSSFDCSNLGDNTVTLTVTDASGNSNSATAVVTVEDVLDPVAVTQDVTVQLDNNGQVFISDSDIDNGSSDNCGIASSVLDVSSFDCSNLGDNTVTLTVTDTSGNSNSATAVVTVEDDLDLVAVTQDISVQLNASGQVSISASDVDDGSSDNCDITSSTLDISNFDCSNLGDNTVILTVTDTSGHSNSATAVVTVEDDLDPIAITQDITVQLDNNGQVSISNSDIDNGSSDNCDITSSTLDISNFDCSNLGDNATTLTITDASGNSNSATAVVTVEDVLDPIAIGKDITVDLADNSSVGIIPEDVDDGSFDNCSNISLSIDVDTFTTIGDFPVQLSVIDQQGNSSSVSVTVTVEDTLGINDPEAFKMNIDLYPNPTQSQLNIKTDANLNSFRTMDINGKVILSDSYTEAPINVAQLSQGIYFILLNTEQGQSVIKRFIKK